MSDENFARAKKKFSFFHNDHQNLEQFSTNSLAYIQYFQEVIWLLTQKFFQKLCRLEEQLSPQQIQQTADIQQRAFRSGKMVHWGEILLQTYLLDVPKIYRLLQKTGINIHKCPHCNQHFQVYFFPDGKHICPGCSQVLHPAIPTEELLISSMRNHFASPRPIAKKLVEASGGFLFLDIHEHMEMRIEELEQEAQEVFQSLEQWLDHPLLLDNVPLDTPQEQIAKNDPCKITGEINRRLLNLNLDSILEAEAVDDDSQYEDGKATSSHIPHLFFGYIQNLQEFFWLIGQKLFARHCCEGKFLSIAQMEQALKVQQRTFCMSRQFHLGEVFLQMSFFEKKQVCEVWRKLGTKILKCNKCDRYFLQFIESEQEYRCHDCLASLQEQGFPYQILIQALRMNFSQPIPLFATVNSRPKLFAFFKYDNSLAEFSPATANICRAVQAYCHSDASSMAISALPLTTEEALAFPQEKAIDGGESQQVLAAAIAIEEAQQTSKPAIVPQDDNDLGKSQPVAHRTEERTTAAKKLESPEPDPETSHYEFDGTLSPISVDQNSLLAKKKSLEGKETLLSRLKQTLAISAKPIFREGSENNAKSGDSKKLQNKKTFFDKLKNTFSIPAIPLTEEERREIFGNSDEAPRQQNLIDKLKKTWAIRSQKKQLDIQSYVRLDGDLKFADTEERPLKQAHRTTKGFNLSESTFKSLPANKPRKTTPGLFISLLFLSISGLIWLMSYSIGEKSSLEKLPATNNGKNSINSVIDNSSDEVPLEIDPQVVVTPAETKPSPPHKPLTTPLQDLLKNKYTSKQLPNKLLSLINRNAFTLKDLPALCQLYYQYIDNNRLRSLIIWSASTIRYPETRNWLEQLVINPARPADVRITLEALENVGDSKACATILQVLHSTPDTANISVCAQILSKLSPTNTDIYAALTQKFYKLKKDEIRLPLLAAIAHMQVENKAPFLLQILRDNQYSVYLREQTIKALIIHSKANKHLVRELEQLETIETEELQEKIRQAVDILSQ